MADRSQLCKSSKYPHELHGLHDELIQTPVVLNYVLTYTRYGLSATSVYLVVVGFRGGEGQPPKILMNSGKLYIVFFHLLNSLCTAPPPPPPLKRNRKQ